MTDDLKPSVLSVAQFRAQVKKAAYRFVDATVGRPSWQKIQDAFRAGVDFAVIHFAEARQTSAWQPISSAPKEAVLLYRPGMNPQDRVSIRRVSDWCGDLCCPSAKPTHWMPLPLAPLEERTERK